VEKLRQVFHAANEQHMAIVIHMRASISRRLPYGREEARARQLWFDVTTVTRNARRTP
jgi:hypothetical protein